MLTTKPRLKIIQRINQKFAKFKEQIQFRFTITSVEDELLKFWEPNAPLFQERFNSLRFAYDQGYKTSVSVEPFLDYNPQNVVNQVAQYSTESIWIGKMNYIPRQNLGKHEEKYYDEIRKNYSHKHLKEVFNSLKETPIIRFKDSIMISLNT